MSDIHVREIGSSAYATFLQQTNHCAFHRLSWLNLVADTFGLRIRLLGYFRDEHLIAVTPLTGRRIGPCMIWGSPLRKCATPAATVFCSPRKLANELLVPLQDWITTQRLGYVQVTAPGSMNHMSRKSGHIEPLDNLELNLGVPLEQLWKSLPKSQKWCVRKSIRSDVRVHWQSGQYMLDAQRALVADTYGKQGIQPNISNQFYKALLSRQKQVDLRVMCATHAGDIVSAVWVFRDVDKCYYWDAASLLRARPLNANHLLVWCLIRWAHRHDMKTLDFVGTARGGRGGSRPGIGRFKQSMGGQPAPYHLIYWYSPWMRAALTGYRLLNRLNTRLRSFFRDNHAHRT